MNYKNKYYKYKLKYLTLKKIIGGSNSEIENLANELVRFAEVAEAESKVEKLEKEFNPIKDKTSDSISRSSSEPYSIGESDMKPVEVSSSETKGGSQNSGSDGNQEAPQQNQEAHQQNQEAHQQNQEALQQNQEAPQQNQEADPYVSDSDLDEDMPVNPIPQQGQDHVSEGEESHVSETQTSETDDEQSETDDEQSEAEKMPRKTPPKKPQRYQPY